MAVTREEVIWAYRMFLAREPESEAMILHQMQAADLAELRSAFRHSAEFRRKFGPAAELPSLNRFLDAAGCDIDMTCSSGQLQAMFDRIAAAWREFGETEPHWSVITSDEFRQQNLAANIDAFYATGQQDIELRLNFLRRAGLSTSFGRAMDFGCGVGRLTLALAPHAKEVVGIDISPPHLRLAEERARSSGADNVVFEPIQTVTDLDRYGGFDLVISLIVLQHNPPPVMAVLLRKLLNSLAPRGVAIVQMPTFIPNQPFSAESYLSTDQPSMEMNALPQSLIFEIIDETGCRPLEIREDSAAGDFGVSHNFAVQRVR